METALKDSNVIIFFDNLSPYYIFSFGITILALLFSYCYSKQCDKELLKKKQQTSEDDIERMERPSRLDKEEVLRNEIHCDDSSPLDALQSRIKVARHQAIVDHLSSKMTPQQLMEEKEAEKAQLEAIFSLLKKQEDLFNVSDMEQVEEQLSLYR